jgi:hypothetical protein
MSWCIFHIRYSPDETKEKCPILYQSDVPLSIRRKGSRDFTFLHHDQRKNLTVENPFLLDLFYFFKDKHCRAQETPFQVNLDPITLQIS